MSRSLVLLCWATIPLTAAEPDPKLVQADVAKLQGLWEVIKVEDNGKEIKELQGSKIVVQGTKWVNGVDGDRYAGTFQIDPTAKLPVIDVHSKINDKIAIVVRGLYRLDDADHVTLIFATEPVIAGEPAVAKADRPTNFEAPGYRARLKRLAVKGDERDLPLSAKPSVTWHVKLAEKEIPAKLPLTGFVPNSWGMDKVPSGYLTTEEQLAELWKVLQVGGPVPQINFAEQTVIVIQTISHGHTIRPFGAEAGDRFRFAVGPGRREGMQSYTIAVFPKAAVDELLTAAKKGK